MTKKKKDPHDLSHELAGVIEEAIEDFLDDNEDEDLPPTVIHLGLQMTQHAWTAFLVSRGFPQYMLLNNAMHGVNCSRKLFAYLNTASRFVRHACDMIGRAGRLGFWRLTLSASSIPDCGRPA